MAGIIKKDFGIPDDTLQFGHGRLLVARVAEEEEVWRSELEPGWNWDEDLEPYAEGATSCPMTHRGPAASGQPNRVDPAITARRDRSASVEENEQASVHRALVLRNRAQLSVLIRSRSAG
jgi:hypothetical protein